MDAIYSPPHLALFFGGLLVCSTGIRSMWAKQDIVPDFKRFLPVPISTTLFIGVAGFITMYLSAFMTNVTPTSDFVSDYQTHFKDDFTDQSISLDGGLTGYGDNQWPYYYYSASHGMASMIITTLVLFGPIMLNLRRWRVPFGADDDDLHRLRPAREHHDRVSRHRPDHPADHHRRSRST